MGKVLGYIFCILIGLQVPSCGVAFLHHHRSSSCVVDAVLSSKLTSTKHIFHRSKTMPLFTSETSSSADLEVTNSKSASFDWERQWYPLAVEDLLDKSKPQPMQLLGKNIVIWYDGQHWKALDDSCPHRAVPLSEGRIESGELMCAYHGWRFDGQGQCTAIPQADSSEKEAKLLQNIHSCAKAYPVRVEQGLLWLWGMSGLPGSDVMIESALKSPRLIEDLLDSKVNGSRMSVFVYDVRDLPYGWDYFMENTLDPAHVVVSHHGRAGNRYRDAKPLNLSRVLSRSELPIEQGGEYNPAYPSDAGFSYMSKPINSRFDAYTTIDFRPPCLNKIDNVRKDGAKFILGAYATPTIPGYCRHISATIIIQNEEAKNIPGLGWFSSNMIPQWLVHIFSSLFVMQDLLFLHKQERNLYQHGYAFGQFASDVKISSDSKVYAKSLFMPNNQDLGVMAIRNWISHKAGGGPKWGIDFNHQLPRLLSNEELFNVYEIHTKHCQKCIQALKNLKTFRTALAAFGVLAAWKFRFNKRSVSIAIGGITALLYSQLSRLIQMFYKQTYSHQDNN